jgi:hypothetical protein
MFAGRVSGALTAGASEAGKWPGEWSRARVMKKDQSGLGLNGRKMDSEGL